MSSAWDGQQYQKAREAVGLTRKQVSEALLVTESTVFRWERGTQVPHIIFQRALWVVVYSKLQEARP